MPELGRVPMRVVRAGVWLLPVYGVLLTLSTLTHQPDPETEFPALSRYVTTDIFLVSHLGASILGAGLGLVGVVAALLLLARGPAAVSAMAGGALTIVANTLLTAVFAAAAFTQPAIGRAFLAGGAGMQDLHDDVYGTPLVLTAGVGLLLFVAGAVLFGRAVARTSPELRWPGYGYAAGLSAFALLGFMLPDLQPVAGAVATVSAVMVALRLPPATLQTRYPDVRTPASSGA
jgi:hypothetical protein